MVIIVIDYIIRDIAMTKNLYNIISISSGKDSTALLLNAIEREVPNLTAVFIDTGNEHPIVYDYINYLSQVTQIPITTIKADFTEEIARRINFITNDWPKNGISDAICQQAIELLKPTNNPFLDMCLWKGMFPSGKRRFCTAELKLYPIYEQVYLPLLDAGNSVEVWQGVRADESYKRAKLPLRDCVGIFENGAEHHNYRPLLHWSVEEVFLQHKKHGIKPNPLYKKGMGRVGCMPCIYCRKNELLQIAMRFPEQIERIVEWEALICKVSKTGKATFFPSRKNRGDGIINVVKWSATKRGSKQIDHDRISEAQTQCHSMYGLCE